MKTMPLTPAARDRLLKTLRLLASDQPGECAAAGAAATRILREAGVGWDDVIPAIQPQAATAAFSAADVAVARYRPDVLWLGRRMHLLTEWERSFVASIRGHHRLTDRQLETLRRIVVDVTGREAAA